MIHLCEQINKILPIVLVFTANPAFKTVIRRLSFDCNSHNVKRVQIINTVMLHGGESITVPYIGSATMVVNNFHQSKVGRSRSVTSQWAVVKYNKYGEEAGTEKMTHQNFPFFDTRVQRGLIRLKKLRPLKMYRAHTKGEFSLNAEACFHDLQNSRKPFRGGESSIDRPGDAIVPVNPVRGERVCWRCNVPIYFFTSPDGFCIHNGIVCSSCHYGICAQCSDVEKHKCRFCGQAFAVNDLERIGAKLIPFKNDS